MDRKITDKDTPSSVSPFDRITALTDGKRALIYEDHARGICRGAAAWSAFHYKRSSEIVVDSWRDGARDIILLDLGEGKLDLVPSFSPAGIGRAGLLHEDDGSESIRVEYSGLAGAGVGITLCRGRARGVLRTEVFQEGGGNRLGRAALYLRAMERMVIGIDDTDSGGKGATWSLANEIGVKLQKMDGVEYLDHTLVQLYPKAPTRTTNCVGTALTFGVLKGRREEFLERLHALLSAGTFSDETSFSVLAGLEAPEELKAFSESVRSRLVTLEELDRFIESCDGVEVHTVTGRMGGIGAVGALGYAGRHEEAVVPAIEPDIPR